MNRQKNNSYEWKQGNSALVLSVPHSGVQIPADISAEMSNEALKLLDTDWFVDRLYACAEQLDVSIINAKYSRYVADLNRDPEGKSLYPGSFTTSLCPLTSFSGAKLYKPNCEPDEIEINRRLAIWSAYHNKLSELIAAAKERHGFVILLDAHSIASRVPTLFEGQLPDLNFGTYSGRSCDNTLIEAIKLVSPGTYHRVFDGRFKGGYITRHYGRPEEGQFAIQLELSQDTYMDEQTNAWDDDKAKNLQDYLHKLLEVLINWRAEVDVN